MLMFKIEMRRLKEKIQMWIAWRLPKWLVMWATIRLIAFATTGKYSDTLVPNLTAMTALDRWEIEKN